MEALQASMAAIDDNGGIKEEIDDAGSVSSTAASADEIASTVGSTATGTYLETGTEDGTATGTAAGGGSTVTPSQAAKAQVEEEEAESSYYVSSVGRNEQIRHPPDAPVGVHVEPDSFYDNAILTFVPGNNNGIPVKDYLVQWHDGDGWHRAVELKQFVILDKDNLHNYTEFGIPGRETGSSAFVPGHNDLEVLEMKVKIPKILRGHRYKFRVQASNIGGVSDWGYADGDLELPEVPKLGRYTRGKMHVKDWVMAKGASAVAKAAGFDDIRYKLIDKYTMPNWAKKKKKRRFARRDFCRGLFSLRLNALRFIHIYL